MRKLDKKIQFANEYKKWQEAHPDHPYDSSRNPFYRDVLTELLILQDGLCAYTEFRLVDRAQLEAYKKGFVEGKQTMEPGTKAMAHLEHFDPRLKDSQAWKWENLFAVLGAINEDKRTKAIDPLMKPDSNEYDPMVMLAYDKDLHQFYPSRKRSVEEQEIIRQAILVLGINNPTIILHRRKELIAALRRHLWFGESVEVDQFPTAFAFITQSQA
jgi:hypothetical protein